MAIQELLSKVLAEHEALQSSYNQALVEINLLRTRLADVGILEDSIIDIAEEDEEAAPLQLQFSCEPVHSTLDSGALVLESETNADAEGVQSCSSADALRNVAGNEDCSRRMSLASTASGSSAASCREMSERRTKSSVKISISATTSDFLRVGSFLTSHESETSNACQDKLIGFLHHTVVELFCVLVVLSNVVVLWVETDRRAARLPKAVWSDVVNLLYLVIYLAEFIVRVLAHRFHVFDDKWNLLDFGVIVIDIFSMGFELIFDSNFSTAINASTFRLLRIFRLVRVFTVFRFVPELQLLIHGFFGAMKAVFFATIMVFIVILLWSFIFVEAIAPQVYELTQAGIFDDCLRCQRSYESMWDAIMTIVQQVVAGDAWGMITMDVIFADPSTSILFLACLMSIQFAVLNLIFTVIVDAAMRARADDEMLQLAEKETSFQNAKEKLSSLCESLDLDGSGDLTFEELVVGYESNKVFADTMASLDITCDDMGALFMILDDDRSGRVTREEFVNNIYKMKERDINTTMMFLKITVEDMRIKMKGEVTDLLKSNLKRSRQAAKHMEKMMSHVESIMQHFEMQQKGSKVQLDALPDEDSSTSVVDAATNGFFSL